MTNTLIDNSDNLKLVDTIKEVLKSPDINQIDIATGYWDIPGTSILADELDTFLEKNGTKLRILIGRDPYLFAKYNRNPKYKEFQKWPEEFIRTDINDIEVKPEYENAVRFLLKYLDKKDKIEIHIYKRNANDETQFLHSKCYIFLDTKNEEAFGIIGSSNFTENGLNDNAELNYLESNWNCVGGIGSQKHKTHEQWFNEKWELSEDWSKEFLEQILRPSKIGQKVGAEQKYGNVDVAGGVADSPSLLTPYENYIKLLQDKFGMITDAEFKSILTGYLPQEIKPLEYQLNAVQQCYSYMLTHGGFALGDVVGLGKTIVGILIIKYYIDVAATLKKSDKVLIIVPPAIKSSWVDTIKKFDANQTDKISEHVTFLTTGSLNHLSEDFSEEDLDDAVDAGNDEDDDENDEELTLSADDKKEVVESMDADLKTFTAEVENYGLVIIDESHKFRNNTTEMYIALSEYLESVHARTGYYPFVGLLSATMQNNSPRDIQNQIYLFEHKPKNSTFEKVPGRDLEHFFAEVNRKYSILIHTHKRGLGIEQSAFSSDVNTKNELIALSKEVREKVLSDILVRRTRTDIKKHYSDDLKFPAVHGPENLFYTMDKKLAQLFSDTMNMIASKTEPGELFPKEGLGYYRYRATMFLNSKYDKVYSGRNMTAQRSSNQLARIMQILLVKRLESSFEAFKESLRNFQRYTQNMITMWEHDTIFICPQIDVNKELNIKEKQEKYPDRIITLETCFDDIRAKIEKLNKEGRNTKNQNAEYSCKDFRKTEGDNSYIEYLKSDLEKINSLVERWNENDYDPKFDRFKSALKESSGLFCRERNIPHKLVIFSEAISTVNSLSRAVENITHKKPLVITAANRDQMETVIKENFDANCEKAKQKSDYDVIITTEVLAEGINLHRANSILNYDTPWNSTRLIQRIGRVNRIGSENENIYVYNFYPSAQGDEQINLVQNAYTKLQSFHTMFGEDAKIFSQEEELSEGNFEAIVDGDESPQEKYIAELKEFQKANKERYDFIDKLDTAEEKAVEPIAQDNEGNSYFAIKVKDKYGCVYVKVDSNLQGEIINYMDMFDSCKNKFDTGEKLLSSVVSLDSKRKVALDTYHGYESKLNKARNANVNITGILEKATQWIGSKKLGIESMSKIGSAIKSIKSGNIILARRLDKLLTAMGNPDEYLIPVTSEEIIEMIDKELGVIATDNNSKNGEAYIFAGFYY